MANKRKFEISTYGLLSFDYREDFLDALSTNFPEGYANRYELFNKLNISRAIDQNVFLNNIGIRSLYDIDLVGKVLWQLSNFFELEPYQIISEAEIKYTFMPVVRSGHADDYIEKNKTIKQQAKKTLSENTIRFEEAVSWLKIPKRTMYRRIKETAFFAIKLAGWFVVVENH